MFLWHPILMVIFLRACGEDLLCEEIRQHYALLEPMLEALHNKAIDLYRCYLITGGMPAVVSEFVQGGKLIGVADIQNKILSDYLADMAKYFCRSGA